MAAICRAFIWCLLYGAVTSPRASTWAQFWPLFADDRSAAVWCNACNSADTSDFNRLRQHNRSDSRLAWAIVCHGRRRTMPGDSFNEPSANTWVRDIWWIANWKSAEKSKCTIFPTEKLFAFLSFLQILILGFWSSFCTPFDGTEMAFYMSLPRIILNLYLHQHQNLL